MRIERRDVGFFFHPVLDVKISQAHVEQDLNL